MTARSASAAIIACALLTGCADDAEVEAAHSRPGCMQEEADALARQLDVQTTTRALRIPD